MNRCWLLIVLLSQIQIVAAVAQPQSGSTVTPSQSRIDIGEELFKKKGYCLFCHGWAADGNGNPRSPGRAANLRLSKLSRDDLLQVIACGRPGTAMPHFDAFAYSDDACFGVKEEQISDKIPPNPPSALQPDEIRAITEYLIAKVIGRGAPTRDECVEFFRELGPCLGYSVGNPSGVYQASASEELAR